MSEKVKEVAKHRKKKTLRRIRDDLSARRSLSSSPASDHHPSPRLTPDVTNHTPRRTTPTLPRLATPPSHEKRRDSRNLREKKFSKVPPVVPKLTFNGTHSDDDSDSWGDDSENETESIHPQMPQPFSYPMPFFVPPTGMYYPPPPMALYYPTVPYGKKKKKAGKNAPSALKKSDRSDERRNYERDFDRNGDFDRHYDDQGNRSYRDYKYINTDFDKPKTVTFQSPLFEAYSPSMRGDFTPRKSVEMSPYELHPIDYFLSNALFADDFTTDFITDCVETDFVPDILLEVLDTWTPQNHQPVPESLPETIYHNCLRDLIKDTVKESSRELAIGIINKTHAHPTDLLEEFLDDVTDAAIAMATRVVVKETIQEMAGDIIQSSVAENVLMGMVDGLVGDLGNDLVEEALWEISAEAAIDDLVIQPEVTECMIHIATETLHHYDSKVYRRELKETKKLASEKLADSFLLQYLLTKISQQGHLWTENDLTDKAVDGAMLNKLLEQMFYVNRDRSETLDNSAMRKLHQRATSNVAMDLFLEQLSASLDEDMADIDECERGITQPAQHTPSIVSSRRPSRISYSAPSNFTSFSS